MNVPSPLCFEIRFPFPDLGFCFPRSSAQRGSEERTYRIWGVVRGVGCGVFVQRVRREKGAQVTADDSVWCMSHEFFLCMER